ncbi:MAG TPA: NnrU family protein [Telmatospirillum sp.]|nr:NnrU family protein [Telmatospirillum sp.]
MDALDLIILVVAAVLFVGGHLGISSTPLRPRLIARLGLQRFRALFSLAAAASLLFLIWAYHNAPFLPLWPESVAARWLALAVMPVALMFLVGALRPDNPTLMDNRPGEAAPEGLFAITRHPLMWGLGLTAIIHILALGDLTSLILFGAIGGLALGGTTLQDARKRKEDPAQWSRLAATTSNVPFLAILGGRARLRWKRLWAPILLGLVSYALLLGGHEFLFGLSPFP